jgi:ankyrin repeat protein
MPWNLPTLLRQKALKDLNTKNLAGETPLHLACASSNTAIVFDICTRGARVTAQDNKQRTPLMTAIMSGNHGSALVILKWEFVVDTDLLALTDDNNMNALQYCILFNDQSTAARIRTIELALLINQQVTPPTRTIYFRPVEE